MPKVEVDIGSREVAKLPGSPEDSVLSNVAGLLDKSCYRELFEAWGKIESRKQKP